MTQPSVDQLLAPGGPAALVVKAVLEPVGGTDRIQPAGFPEVGHVIYDAPRPSGTEKVCIVDSAASMANHLEAVCLSGPNDPELVPDLSGLPYVACYTDRKHCIDKENRIVLDPNDPHDRLVATTLTEGHRLASDYFLDGLVKPEWRMAAANGRTAGGEWTGTSFRSVLRDAFGLTEVQKDKKYFLSPTDWWGVYSGIFAYDPNSLVHGVLFAREQLKISRILTGHLEAFGAARVGRSGVKFDRLGKTTSGQPIFSVDEEVAREIRATFIIDLGLVRSYGRDGHGLDPEEKQLVLELALFKIGRLTSGEPFRYRSQCFLACKSVDVEAGGRPVSMPAIEMQAAIRRCKFEHGKTNVYYPADQLFKAGAGSDEQGGEGDRDE